MRKFYPYCTLMVSVFMVLSIVLSGISITPSLSGKPVSDLLSEVDKTAVTGAAETPAATEKVMAEPYITGGINGISRGDSEEEPDEFISEESVSIESETNTAEVTPSATPIQTTPATEQPASESQTEQPTPVPTPIKIIPNISTEKLLNSITLNPMITNNKAIDEKVAEITGEGSTYEKVKRCYDWLIDNVSYERSYPPVPGGIPKGPFPAWILRYAVGPLFEGYGKCNNYAAALTIMLRAIGIEAYTVTGQTRAAAGGFIGHLWTVAYINDIEYIFDAQVEDNVAERSDGLVRYMYFCKARENMTDRYIWEDEYNSGLIAEFGERTVIVTYNE